MQFALTIYVQAYMPEGMCGVTSQVPAAYQPITPNDSVGYSVWDFGKDEKIQGPGLFNNAGDNDVPQRLP